MTVRLRWSGLLAVALWVLGVMAQGVWAQEPIIVDVGESIQDAVDEAGPGSEIIVSAGEYQEDVRVNKDRLTIVSEEMAKDGSIAIAGGLTVASQGFWAVGVQAAGGGTWDLELSGDVEVEAAALAMGINVLPGAEGAEMALTMSGTGDTAVHAGFAAAGIVVGWAVDPADPENPWQVPMDSVSLEYHGDISVKAEGENSIAYGVIIEADSGSVTLSGDTELEAGAFAGAMHIGLGDRGSVAVGGDVTVSTASGAGYGVYVDTGQDGTVTVSGTVAVTGGSYADAVDVDVGDGGRVVISGPATAIAQGPEGEAYGVWVKGGDNNEITLTSSVTVAGALYADAVYVSMGESGTAVISGNVAATTTSTRSDEDGAWGVSFDMGAGSTLTVSGAVSLSAAGFAIAVYGDAGERGAVHVSGAVTAESEQDDAWGVYVDVGSGSTLTVSGAVAASAGLDATAVDVLVGDGSSVMISGGVTVTAGGEASGVQVFTIGNAGVSVSGGVSVTGGGYARGVSLNIGDGTQAEVRDAVSVRSQGPAFGGDGHRRGRLERREFYPRGGRGAGRHAGWLRRPADQGCRIRGRHGGRVTGGGRARRQARGGVDQLRDHHGAQRGAEHLGAVRRRRSRSVRRRERREHHQHRPDRCRTRRSGAGHAGFSGQPPAHQLGHLERPHPIGRGRRGLWCSRRPRRSRATSTSAPVEPSTSSSTPAPAWTVI